MSEKAVLTLNGNTPDASEVQDFLTIMFGTNWPRGIEDKISEFANLVYSVTRQAGITIYSDAEISPFLKQDRCYAVAFDETCGAWLVIVASGKEYSGTMDALRFISRQLSTSVQ